MSRNPNADSIKITPLNGPLDARVRPPGSKSLTNRALVCAALARGQSMLSGALDSEDTRVMTESLRRLGIRIDAADEATTLTVTGCGGAIPRHGGEFYVANSGTTVRFLTALVTLGHGTYRLVGTERMHQRPIEDLLVALRALGADARSEQPGGCPPVLVEARGLPGRAARVRGEISSQFLSALLMVAPYAQQGARLEVVGPLVSRPYVEMTLAVMRAFGVDVAASDLSRFEIPSGAGYRGCAYAIEPDASAASYFFAAAAITGGRVTVEGLSRESLQGDVGFCALLEQMGCRVEYEAEGITVCGGPLSGIDADMNQISDTAQTLAVVALFARETTTIRGVAHMRHKETDRIGDLATELRKLGAEVEELADGLKITPRPLRGARLDTYNDHRMAMSLALVGLKVPGVVIDNPACTAKTYPSFFDDLARLQRG